MTRIAPQRADRLARPLASGGAEERIANMEPLVLADDGQDEVVVSIVGLHSVGVMHDFIGTESAPAPRLDDAPMFKHVPVAARVRMLGTEQERIALPVDVTAALPCSTGLSGGATLTVAGDVRQWLALHVSETANRPWCRRRRHSAAAAAERHHGRDYNTCFRTQKA